MRNQSSKSGKRKLWPEERRVSVPARVRAFRPLVLSRHPTHNPLRTQLPRLPFRSVVRLGSTTPNERLNHGDRRIECNTVEAIKNSADKLRMKTCFLAGNVKTAVWVGGCAQPVNPRSGLQYPVIVKHRFGSRGNGIALINNAEEWTRWQSGKTMANYIVEKYHDYSREYRLHVTKDGCDLAFRKLLKDNVPEERRFIRNDDTCVWIVETNPSFNRPTNWNAITEECVKAMRACGLDFGACDVRVQTSIDKRGRPRANPEFIVIEINSAPGFGEFALQHYLRVIPQILRDKQQQR